MMNKIPLPPSPIKTQEQHRSGPLLSMGQITQAKATFTKQIKQRARDAILSSRVAAVLSHELEELNSNPFPTITAGPEGDDIMRWDCYIMGPENTPYFSGLFRIRLTFPTTYPVSPNSSRPRLFVSLLCFQFCTRTSNQTVNILIFFFVLYVYLEL